MWGDPAKEVKEALTSCFPSAPQGWSTVAREVSHVQQEGKTMYRMQMVATGEYSEVTDWWEYREKVMKPRNLVLPGDIPVLLQPTFIHLDPYQRIQWEANVIGQ